MKTYKFVDEKGRRLAIFGSLEGKLLKIHVIKCSVNDQFSKKVAREAYASVLKGETTYHPDVFLIPAGDNPYSTMLKWARDKYYIKFTQSFDMKRLGLTPIQMFTVNKRAKSLSYLVKPSVKEQIIDVIGIA